MTDGAVLGISDRGFVRGIQGFGHVAGVAVGIDDHDARAAIFLGAKAQHLFKRVDRGGVVARLAIQLAELLIQNGQRAAARRREFGFAPSPPSPRRKEREWNRRSRPSAS